MTTIRTTCVDCGDIDVAVGEISLELVSGGRAGIYRYVCPSCGARNDRPASGGVVEALVAMGAARRHLPDAKPITQQEIDEFVASLDIDEWVHEVIPPEESDD
jgi:hypothetical protein